MSPEDSFTLDPLDLVPAQVIPQCAEPMFGTLSDHPGRQMTFLHGFQAHQGASGRKSQSPKVAHAHALWSNRVEDNCLRGIDEAFSCVMEPHAEFGLFAVDERSAFAA